MGSRGISFTKIAPDRYFHISRTYLRSEVVKVNSKIPFWPPFDPLKDSNGGQTLVLALSTWKLAKTDLFGSYERISSYIWVKSPLSPRFDPLPPKGSRGSSRGQILFFTRSLPNLHRITLFESYQHFLSQIWEQSVLRPLFDSQKESGGIKC